MRPALAGRRGLPTGQRVGHRLYSTISLPIVLVPFARRSWLQLSPDSLGGLESKHGVMMGQWFVLFFHSFSKRASSTVVTRPDVVLRAEQVPSAVVLWEQQ